MNSSVVARPCWSVLSLLTLMQRVSTDIQHTQNLLDSYKERLLEVERERIKMQTLADHNALAVQKSLNRKEQKQMDSLGVMQFNLKPQT